MNESLAAAFLTGADRVPDHEAFRLRRARIAEIRALLDEISAETRTLQNQVARPGVARTDDQVGGPGVACGDDQVALPSVARTSDRTPARATARHEAKGLPRDLHRALTRWTGEPRLLAC